MKAAHYRKVSPRQIVAFTFQSRMDWAVLILKSHASCAFRANKIIGVLFKGRV
jgi:hypothetical protein